MTDKRMILKRQTNELFLNGRLTNDSFMADKRIVLKWQINE